MAIPLTAIATFLAATFFALSVRAQDLPGGPSRGPIPPVTRQILAALDAAVPALTRDVLLVSSRAACPPAPKVISQGDQKTIGGYFSKYYIDVDELEVLVSGRVTIGPKIIGYVIDAPGKYDLSVVDLWTYDVANNRWQKPMELSENWGDAGEYYYSDSLLVDVDGDGYKDIVKRGKHGMLDMGPKRPERVFFDKTVVRKIIGGAFRDAGAPPKFLKDRLLALEKKLDCE